MQQIKIESRNFRGYLTNEEYINVTDETIEGLKNLCKDDIINFLRNDIVGKRTTLGYTRIADCYVVGNIHMSLQIHYYVWSHRTDKIGFRQEYHDTPITMEEFNDCIDGLLDVLVWAKSEEKHVTIIPATQMYIGDIVDDIKTLGETMLYIKDDDWM